MRSSCARDAHGKGNISAGYGCIGVSDLWNTPPRTGVERKTVLRPMACASKVLSDTVMKYGAPKAIMLAIVTFVEKYRA